jgi:hypothetical protein
VARYFFHLRDGKDQLLDPDGIELPDQRAIEVAALKAARDTLSHELRAGRLDLRYRIDVEDECGTVVHSIDLADAFETIC